jgi:hypothetical protein
MNLDLQQQYFSTKVFWKIFRLTFGILAITSLFSCGSKWRSYVVKAGNHSTNDLSLPTMNLDRIEFKFKADSSWYYPAPPNPGWNKIRGFSNGHHQNNSSARLGYQCLSDSVLVVGAYCYVNGVSPQENPAQKGIIDTILPGRVYHCEIKRQNSKYIFDFEDKMWECPAGKAINWGYLLNPYVGGEFILDHDWHIEIKDIK